MAIWGGNSSLNGSDFGISWCRAMAGDFAPGSDQQLDSVEIYLGGFTADAIRVAVYEGGTSDTDPNGATLVEDLGDQVPGATGYLTFTSATNPTLTNNTRLWIVAKGENAGNQTRASTNSSDAEDFYSAQGRIELTGQTGGADDGLAYPSVMDNTGASASNFWYAWRLNYSSGDTTAPNRPTILRPGSVQGSRPFIINPNGGTNGVVIF